MKLQYTCEGGFFVLWGCLRNFLEYLLIDLSQKGKKKPARVAGKILHKFLDAFLEVI
jgi:hypothetical protein